MSENNNYNEIGDFKELLDKLIDNKNKYNENINQIKHILQLIKKIDEGLLFQLRNEIKNRTTILLGEINVLIKERRLEIKKEIKEAEIQIETLLTSQIERKIAKQIIDKYKIVTFEETDEICLYQNGVFLRNKISRAKIRKEILKIVSEKFDEYQETLGKRGMIMELIKNMTFYPMEKFGLKAEIINLRNGIIKYKDDKLTFTSHKKLDDRKEILYTFIQFPIYYKKGAKCPTISRMLEDIFGIDQYIDIIEFVSYTLFPTLRFDKALILHGPTKTGETTFLNMIIQFLGRFNISDLELYRLAKQFQVENLRFKAANICDDLAPLPFKYSACSWIKKLITNMYLEGEMKGIQGNKPWINVCKLICACNKLPIPDDKTDAWWRRWIGASCINQFIGKKNEPKFKYMRWNREEMSGLLNKCLIAWLRLNRRGGFRNKWQDPDYVKLWWMSNIDPVFEFVKKYCNIGDSDQTIGYEVFINCFNQKRRERGLKPLSKSLITRGLKQIDERIKKYKKGVQSNPEADIHYFKYIGWNGFLFVEGNETAQAEYEKIVGKTSEEIKKEYEESLESTEGFVEFGKLDIDKDIEVYDPALGRTVKINK